MHEKLFYQPFVTHCKKALTSVPKSSFHLSTYTHPQVNGNSNTLVSLRTYEPNHRTSKHTHTQIPGVGFFTSVSGTEVDIDTNQKRRTNQKIKQTPYKPNHNPHNNITQDKQLLPEEISKKAASLG